MDHALLRRTLTEAYTRLSPYADSQRWEFDNNLFHLAFLTSRITKQETIIDLGCGIGILALTLKLLGYSVVGVDKYIFEPSNSYSVQDMEKLKKIWRDNSLNISSGDANDSASLNSTAFDVVVSVAVIEHQSNLKEFMSGLLCAVKKGGRIYIATPNVANLLNRFRFLCGRAPLSNISEFYEKGAHFVGHWREYTVAELREIGRLSGCEVLEAGNAQTLRPYATRNFRKWHRLAARLIARCIPGSGDTNYLWLKK